MEVVGTSGRWMLKQRSRSHLVTSQASTSVSVPDTACHWYVVNPDNTFGKGFSWITAPEFDVAALNDIGAQHEVTISQGYQTTVELMNANSNVKYGDDY
jgi:hypothetical protein